MFQKDMLKHWPTSHLLQCGWYFNYPKNNTHTLETPLRESIEPSFKETLANSIGTHVEGGKRKIISKVKGKLKEKMIKPPSSDANQAPLLRFL